LLVASRALGGLVVDEGHLVLLHQFEQHAHAVGHVDHLADQAVQVTGIDLEFVALGSGPSEGFAFSTSSR